MHDRQALFGTLFAAANKLQITSDLFLGEVTTKQWLLLESVDGFFPEKPSLSKLVPHVGSSRQNIKQLALKLEGTGLLAIERDPEDSRSHILSITEKAREFRNLRKKDVGEFINSLFSGIPDGDIHVALEVLQRIEANAAKMHEEYI